MKVTVNDNKPAFKPITIELEIATRDELAALWHRLDVGGGFLQKRYLHADPKVSFPEEWSKRDASPGNPKDCTEELFKAIDSLAVKHDLRSGGQIGH